MRTHTIKHGKILIAQAKVQSSLIFAILFGVVMLIIGLSQLFAQSTMAFIFQPYSQSANANEDRSLWINLINSGQKVDGGSVKIIYNSAQLSFVAFNESGNPYVTTSNKVSLAGSYSFDFRVASGSPDTPSLGSITLKAKSLSSSQPAYIKFDSAGTNAYVGVNAGSRTYYPTTNGQASIVINADPAVTTQPPSQPPASTSQPASQPPATSSRPPAASRPPTSVTSPAPIATSNSPAVNSSQAPNAQPFIPEEFVEDGQNYVPPSEPILKPRRIAPIVFISIGVIILALAGGAYVYLKYIRILPVGMGASRPLHTGLFDDSPEPEAEEGIVIAPSASPVNGVREPELKPEPKTHPHIITKSKERAMHRQEVEERQKKSTSRQEASTEHPAKIVAERPSEVKRPVQHDKPVPHKPEQPHHEESETITVPIHPHTSPIPHVPHPEAPAAQVKSLPNLQPPINPPPLMPVTMDSQPAKEIKKPVPDPGHQVPEWQTKLNVPHSTAPVDDPPDMFELAHDHPESFGSSQLYDVETKEKENHDEA